MAGLSIVLTLYLRLGAEGLEAYRGDLPIALAAFVGIVAVAGPLTGLNAGIWRYASLRDAIAICRTATVAILCFLLLMFLLTRLDGLPRSVPVINWFVLIVLLGGPRLAYRLWKDGRLSSILGVSDRIPVLLVGASTGADLFIRSMSMRQDARYRPVGVIDDKGGRVGREIQGVPVLGTIPDLPAVVQALAERGDGPQRLILTKPPQHLAPGVVPGLVAKAEELNLSISRLPDLTDFHEGLQEGGVEPRPIAIEDLLGRPPVALDRGAIGALVRDRRVLVTGAGGSIGSELVRQVARLAPRQLVLVENSEFNLYRIEMEIREAHPGLALRPLLADVRDRGRIGRIFAEEKPELVFHAAALKHVPMVEGSPLEGLQTNVVGTRNVADAAREVAAAAMVFISTDKAINPTNVMGASKRIAESYCQALDLQGGTRFITVRFGNVLGSTGSVVPLFERQLRSGGPITVTHPDITRYFMTIREAVELVLQASAYGQGHGEQRGRIFVLDMGQPIKIVDLARQMIRLAGLQPDKDVRIVFTGLRPGEKLYEELFDSAEPPMATDAEGVLVAAPRSVDLAIIGRGIDELQAAIRASDVARGIGLMRHLVPEYRPAEHDAAQAAGAVS
ncbi:MAG TPA: nucleoside-diphosphate sugar epimerase/dehydratase [Alphaproteobacteria bacterium]|nr:nucleoside-diphosphate sugar epimerase/dehydratase [Alphaproteobacteria bacterium]